MPANARLEVKRHQERLKKLNTIMNSGIANQKMPLRQFNDSSVNLGPPKQRQTGIATKAMNSKSQVRAEIFVTIAIGLVIKAKGLNMLSTAISGSITSAWRFVKNWRINASRGTSRFFDLG